MAALKNPRWEAFAQAVASGMSPPDAFRKVAGKKRAGDREMASRWLTKVDERLRELQQTAAADTLLTIREKRTICADESRKTTNSLRDRLAAIDMDSKLAGHFPDKAGVNLTVGVEVNNVLTEERRKELMDRRLASIKLGSS